MSYRLDSLAKMHLSNDIWQVTPQQITLKQLFEQPEIVQDQKSTPINAELAINEAKIALLKREYGLELKAGYLENIDEGIFGPGDIFYERRAKLEVEWDLLKNGLFENRYKIDELQLEKTGIEQEIEQNKSVQKYDLLYNRIIYYFNLGRMKVIENYLHLENTMLAVTSKLHELHFVPWNEVLKEMGQKARLENKLKAYRTYNEQFAGLSLSKVNAFELPLVDVNIQVLSQESDVPSDRNATINSTFLEYNPLLDIGVSVYARYNLFGGTGRSPLPAESFGGREYFSAGIDVSLPLFFNVKNKKKLKKLERSVEIEKNKNENVDRKNEIYNHYFEYQFTLQQYIQFNTKYLNIKEEIRKQTVLTSSDPSYSPRKLTKLLGVRYQIVIALLDLKQKLYLKLLKLGTYTPAPISEFVEPVELGSSFKQELSATYSLADNLYIWSSGFGQHDNPALIYLLKEYSISTVHLSFSTGQLEKAKDFVERAHRNQIKVLLLVGNNQLIFYETHQNELEDYFRKAAQAGMDGVHLDVEPQVFDDWDKTKNAYQKLFVGLLQNAYPLAQRQNLKLSVSIPHYFDNILKEINSYADAVFLMAYGTADPEQIKKRIADEAAMFRCKLVVSLRPSDFISMKKLNETIRQVGTEPCQNFALHDLAAFIRLINTSTNDEK